MNENECVKTWPYYIGFAQFYIAQCHRKSNPNIEIDKELYSKLLKLDTRLGTRASDQLKECLLKTTRSDIIKVSNLLRIKDLN